MKNIGFKCPHCANRAYVIATEAVTDTLDTRRCGCRHCGAEMIFSISCMRTVKTPEKAEAERRKELLHS